ncbi:MAG TPA: helix-turn-helix domain-containing GNAT family N-acetyltransferase [Bauldia sp.]|nr:helix-turn-helix domain-containing GNAT family N-acetyltransferase [Bauldia sp.]
MDDKSNGSSGGQIAAIRAFNRFYTRRIGALDEHLVGSGFSLAEARVLYELAERDRVSAADLARELALDPGYLSRLLAAFARRKLITRRRAEGDGRLVLVSLTAKGREAFAALDARSSDAVQQMIAPLAAADRRRLVEAMQAIRAALGDAPSTARRSLVLRSHQPGDIGWVVHRQGRLYAEEYGWDETYEALVAEILSSFIKNFDATRERAWIAEMDGEIVGSVFLVRATDEVAKLRLLYVEPKARGLGLGTRLVEECVAFARGKGYRTLTLWTNDVLASARRIYESQGFRLISQGRHKSFGKDLVGQTWELALRG